MCWKDGIGCPPDSSSEERDVEHIAWLQKAANLGHADAQVVEGQRLQLAESHERAVAQYRKAAAQGHGGGLFWLGEALWHGLGVGCDRTEAFSLFRRSADTGHKAATYTLAHVYQRGDGGVETDAAEAFRLFQRYVMLEGGATPLPAGAAGLGGDARYEPHPVNHLGRAMQVARPRVFAFDPALA